MIQPEFSTKIDIGGKFVKKFVNAVYVLNITFQAFFNLAMPIGFGLLFSWLSVKYLSAPKWIYAPLTVLGALIGFYTMVKFILSAMAALERLEKETNIKGKTGNNNEEK